MSEAPRAPAENPARFPNLLQRIGMVFVSPGALFEHLKARPVWVDVMVLMVALNVVASLLLPEEALRQIIEGQMPPDAEPAQIESAMGFARTWGLVLSVLGTPISVAVVAGVLLLAYNVVLGGEATYRQLFSAASHAFLVLVVGGLLTIGLLIAGGEQVVLSPGLLIPGLGEGYLARFLLRINVFALWNVALLAMAVKRIYPKRSAGGAAAYLLTLYALVVGVSAIPGGA